VTELYLTWPGFLRRDWEREKDLLEAELSWLALLLLCLLDLFLLDLDLEVLFS
jgi:hypothetical protein